MRIPAVLKGLLLVSGWALAGWLFLSRTEPPPPVVEAPRPEVPVEPPKGPVPAKEPVPTESPISAAFQKWSEDPALAGALVGFCVLDEFGKPIFTSSLAEHALCPASALKTVTTAAAFEILGPGFQFETSVAASSAPDANGLLNGDLILIGGGDPTLTSEDIAALADTIAKAGIKRISGRILTDLTVFPQPPVSDHWNWGDIGNAYGAGAYGLNVDHNRLSVTFAPAAKPGAPATLQDIAPVARDTRPVSRVTTGDPGSGDGVMIYSEPDGRRITLTGTVPAGEKDFTVGGAIPDPPTLAAELLETRLKSSGIKIEGKTLPASSDRKILAVHRSALLPEIIDHLHRVSDNLEAQCLFYAIGKMKDADPAAALKTFWQEKGVTFSGLRLIDGSGLARATMIRPLDLALVNHHARRGPHGNRFKQSLSTYLDGAVRSKLGAMSGVKTDVGFLTTQDGRELTYCLMANGLDPAVNFWPLREQLLRAIR
ncbi:MAG: D-alanyl-D-alanine carboxypeptidase/D-alanyl-D-alanine-endopeptidase [Verrucomicrobiaceae bacterium]|nr:MAG: D-alanyl-D-alanine carboxypeptidase/D-alanyl-D-alanine-endopeptidase [Verrucomicrobiaceae bacterium]